MSDEERSRVVISNDGVRFLVEERILVNSGRLKTKMEQEEGAISVEVSSIDFANILAYLNRPSDIQEMIAGIEGESLVKLRDTASYLDIPEMVQKLEERIQPPIYLLISTEGGKVVSVDLRAITLSPFMRRKFVVEVGSQPDPVFKVPVISTIFQLAVDYMHYHSRVIFVRDLDAWDKSFLDLPESTLWALLDCSIKLEIKELAVIVAMKLEKLEKSKAWSTTQLCTALGGAVLVVGVSSYFGLNYVREVKVAAVETFQGVNKTVQNLPSTGEKAEGVARDIGKKVGSDIAEAIKSSISPLISFGKTSAIVFGAIYCIFRLGRASLRHYKPT